MLEVLPPVPSDQMYCNILQSTCGCYMMQGADLRWNVSFSKSLIWALAPADCLDWRAKFQIIVNIILNTFCMLASLAFNKSIVRAFFLSISIVVTSLLSASSSSILSVQVCGVWLACYGVHLCLFFHCSSSQIFLIADAFWLFPDIVCSAISSAFITLYMKGHYIIIVTYRCTYCSGVMVYCPLPFL